MSTGYTLLSRSDLHFKFLTFVHSGALISSQFAPQHGGVYLLTSTDTEFIDVTAPYQSRWYWINYAALSARETTIFNFQLLAFSLFQ